MLNFNSLKFILKYGINTESSDISTPLMLNFNSLKFILKYGMKIHPFLAYA